MSGIDDRDLQGERRAVAVAERVEPPSQAQLVPRSEQARHDDDGERDARQRGEPTNLRRLDPSKETEEEPCEAADPRPDPHEVEPLREHHPGRPRVTTRRAGQHRARGRDGERHERGPCRPQHRRQHGDARHADRDRQQDELPARLRREQRPERHAHGRPLGERHQHHADRRAHPPDPEEPRADVGRSERDETGHAGTEQDHEPHVEEPMTRDGRGARRFGLAGGSGHGCDLRLRDADPEREGAGRDVAVRRRHGSPRHGEDAVGQGVEPNADLAVRARRAFGGTRWHGCARCIEDADGREREIGRLRERQGDLIRRTVEQLAVRGVARLEGGMGEDLRRGRAQPQARDDADGQGEPDPLHGPSLMNCVIAVTLGLNGPWSAATNSACRTWGPGSR